MTKQFTILKPLILLIIFIGCQRNNDVKNPKSTKENIWEIKSNGENITQIKWKEYENDSLTLKVPIEWNETPQKDSWVYFPQDKNNTKLYFGIMKYNTSVINMNLEEYLKEGFHQVSSKINGFRYILKKLDFNNSTHCYILTIFTKEKGEKYITYSLVYQSKNQIYDFAYKTFDDEKISEINYRKFLLIVFSFEFNRKKIFESPNLFINREKELKFEDL
ncbi:hypothetical protein [Flavobacterium soli]|uniref:hypothetical protein n=1 Tax=Flavobacterium soli TaxID=344881 RepID=UPI000421F64B|nr:hypothetical protein [Flavobacterium soli]